MDVEAIEAIEAPLDQFIERRAREKEDADRTEERLFLEKYGSLAVEMVRGEGALLD